MCGEDRATTSSTPCLQAPIAHEVCLLKPWQAKPEATGPSLALLIT